MRECVIPFGQGGIATSVGEHRQLSVTIKSATTPLRCEEPARHNPGFRAYCQQVLNAMPASISPSTFGNEGLRAKVDLPLVFEDGPCAFLLSSPKLMIGSVKTL